MMDGDPTRAGVHGLLRAVQQLCAARDMSEVIEIVRTSARRLVGAEGATFVLPDGDHVYYAAEDAISPLWAGRRFPASACISGWAMQHRQSVTIRDIRLDARVPQDAYLPTFVRSLAMIPVQREQPLAAIGVYWARERDVTDEELALLQALADATATAVTNAELYRGLVSAQSELLHASTRLQLALDAGAIGTWDMDPRSAALRCDARARELFGLPADTTVDYAGFLARVHPEDRERVRTQSQAALDGAGGKDGHFDTELRGVAADGTVRWLAACGRVQFGPEGRAERFTGIVRDITPQKRADAEKSELLRQANAANLAKDEFLAMLGHELRNPLAPIVTAVELLKQQGHAHTREVATIDRQSQHLVRLVDDLLDIARVTRGKLELKRRVVELRSVVSKAIEMVSPLIERRQQQLLLDLPANVHVDADEFRLAQLLSNLLSNAAKNTPDAGQIRIQARVRGELLSLTVQDTGCGIGAELLPRLFSPFVQAGQSSARSQGGLGLGLAIARSLVEAHGGSISAASEGPGKGSVFQVELPIAAQSAPRTAAPEAALDAAVSSRSILVVDDNEDAAELLALGLRQRGHRVQVALDPVEALSAVRSDRPDIALLDIGLPVMDGYELATQLRAELAGHCPALIAITGYGQENDRRRSADAGFALHLVKPVQLDAVLEAVARVAPAAAQSGAVL